MTATFFGRSFHHQSPGLRALKVDIKLNETPEGADRRSFLVKAGQFAVIVPPAMTFLLSTTMSSQAIASSNNGRGNGCDPQPPGSPKPNDTAGCS